MAEVSGVEVDVGGIGFEHLREYRTADDVTGSEFCGWVVSFHEWFMVAVEEDCAFASECFCDECSGGSCDV